MPADKNPSPRANEDFRRVTDAFDILGDPASRKRYDAGVRWEEQRRRGSREQEKRREKMRRQKKEREEKERLRAHSEMMRRARATQGRMVKISSFGEFEKEMLDPSGRVYRTHALIMFVGNRGAERKGEETMYFPYPFAGETNGNVNSRHAGIKVARVRFNAQTELTRHFRARSGSGGEPHIVFARRGDPVGTFHVFQPWREAGAADVHGKLKQWVESMLVIRVTIVNRHSLPVELMVLRNGRIVHGRQSLPSTYEIAFSLQAGDRVVAFDARVDAYHPGVARTDARIPLFPGSSCSMRSWATRPVTMTRSTRFRTGGVTICPRSATAGRGGRISAWSTRSSCTTCVRSPATSAAITSHLTFSTWHSTSRYTSFRDFSGGGSDTGGRSRKTWGAF